MKLELKKIMQTEKMVVGKDRTIKMLKNGKLKKVFMASNCPSNIKKQIKYYAKITSVEVIELKENNEEIGIICKKPFSISILSY